MAATQEPITLRGAPDTDLGSKDAKHTPVPVMQLEMTQDVVDELLESARSGKLPQILFGRTPVGTLCLTEGGGACLRLPPTPFVESGMLLY